MMVFGYSAIVVSRPVRWCLILYIQGFALRVRMGLVRLVTAFSQPKRAKTRRSGSPR